RVSRERSRMRAGELVELALETDAVLATPQEAYDLDRFLQRGHGFAGRAQRSVVGLDPIPETARAKAELEPAAAQDVERGGGFGEHGRWAQRDVGHVGEDGDPLSAHGNRCEQSPRVVEAALVGVILDPDQVEAEL